MMLFVWNEGIHASYFHLIILKNNIPSHGIISDKTMFQKGIGTDLKKIFSEADLNYSET